jgi:hypothetical protein
VVGCRGGLVPPGEFGVGGQVAGGAGEHQVADEGAAGGAGAGVVDEGCWRRLLCWLFLFLFTSSSSLLLVLGRGAELGRVYGRG